ncbi:hypothetical protein [Fodinibius halophilus]|uniref:Uncharacterized protein n=1 Tax=Fodinibius halophilus TaxID=1736908 RepID=A0A6M1TIQ7_9BACT|nr:hypothetical protein [Fodinibius halophilus]NGP89932.1 hypothetical protein [Fodinibius halophilus]
MGSILEVISILLFIFSLWLGYEKIETSKLTQSILFVADLSLIIVGVIQLGSLGVWIALTANFLGILIYSARLAMKKEELLVSASTQGGFEREEVENLYEELGESNNIFEYVGPIERAKIIYLISQRGRNLEEIKKLAIVIALIWYVQKLDLEILVKKFDRLLRLWDKTVDDAMDVADTLTKGNQMSAADFEENLDAMIAFKDPF